MLTRLQRALAALDTEQRLAGLAAIALTVTLFLPWYSVSVARERAFIGDSRTAFGVFSFVEAAVLLVAVGVLALLFARGERRGFHLPGGDGTVILGAGAWAAVLLLWRVFDRPDVAGEAAQVGISWGFFFAFMAAAALALAGLRMRQADRPEPPNPAAEEPPATPIWADDLPVEPLPATAPGGRGREDRAVEDRPRRPRRRTVRPPAGEDDDDSPEFRRPPEFRLPGDPRE